MRIAIAGFMHESNTFSHTRTDRAAFESASLRFGEAIIAEWKDAHHEIAGFIQGAHEYEYEIDPLVMAWATPSGPVTDDVLDLVVDDIIQSIRPKMRHGRAAATSGAAVDGLLLALHGAMVCEGYPDGDGEVLRRLRQALGAEFPIVVTLDFHANVSEQMVRHATAMVMYQTNPHVDQRARGLHAASIMARTVRGEIHPVQAIAKPPTLITIACQNTSFAPLEPLLRDARSLERQPGILAANIAAGFPYADVFEMGPSVVVTSDGDSARAASEADRLAHALFAARRDLVRPLPDARTAVARAMAADRRPTILVDFGDNIGGGSPGDGTILLAELIAQRASGSLVAIFDPEAVRRAAQAGVGSDVGLDIGAKTDRLHGNPIRLQARVVSLHDGHWIEDAPRHGGRRHNDQGETAVLAIAPERMDSDGAATDSDDANFVIVNSKRTPPFSLGQITSLGIDPARRRIIVVKAAIAYRAAYGPVAAEIIEVDTPGWTANDPRYLEYRHVRRPLFPLDPA